MNLKAAIGRLTDNGDVIHKLLASITTEQAQYKPSADSWSMLEVVNPAELAYGDQSVGGVITPASTLIFDIELISANP